MSNTTMQMSGTPPVDSGPAEECKREGHDWQIIWATWNLKHSLAMVVCDRCNEVGWQE